MTTLDPSYDQTHGPQNSTNNQPLVPRGTELDFSSGKCFVSVGGFQFLDTRVMGVAVPFHRDFEEVNLRFYVKRLAGAETRRASSS